MSYYSPQDLLDLANGCIANNTSLNECELLARGLLDNKDLLIPRPPYKLLFSLMQFAVFHGVMALMTKLFSLGL